MHEVFELVEAVSSHNILWWGMLHNSDVWVDQGAISGKVSKHRNTTSERNSTVIV